MTQNEEKRRFVGRITAIAPLSPDVVRATVALDADFLWSPGQYLALQVPGGSELAYYSIASADGRVPADEAETVQLELAINAPSWRLEQPLEVGLQLQVRPAAGGPNYEQLRAASSVVLVGMGTGVAPLRALVQALLAEPTPLKVVLIQGARDRQSCLFFDEFSDYPGLEYRPVFSREASSGSEGQAARTGRVQAHLLDVIDGAGQYCVCGSRVMVDEVSALLGERGVSKSQIFAEGY